MRNVGIKRRFFAFVLDGFVFLCFLGVIYVSQGYQSAFFLGDELPDRLLYPYLVLILAYLFDQIICPVLFGLTLTRWICGYRIKRRDGRNPSLGQSLIRFLSILIIEFFTIGILTFITSVFRKDKATIHDIFSSTYAVFQETQKRRRLFRIALIGTVIVLGALLSLNIVTYSIHDIFVKPVKQEALSRGLPLYPPTRLNVHQLSEGAVIMKGLSLFNLRNKESAHFCLLGNEDGLDKYVLSIGNDKFKVLHHRAPLHHPPFYSEEPSTWERLLSFVLKSDPFLEPPYRIAEKTYHNDDVDFPLFSPVNNIFRLGASVLWAIAVPVHQGEHAIIGEMSFAVIHSFHNEKYSLQSIKVIRNDVMELYDILSIHPTESMRNILERVPHEAQIIEQPPDKSIDYKLCSNEKE